MPGLISGPTPAARGGKIVHTEATGLLAAGLAHDLNNMLGGILAMTELLQGRFSADSDEWTDLAAIAEQATKASALVRQILAFSRQEILVSRTATMAELVDRMMPVFVSIAGQRLERCDDGGEACVRIDPTAFERAAVNLLLNACAATAPEGHIRVSAGRIGPADIPADARAFMPAAHYGVFRVEDDGEGVAPEHVARLFDPYFSTREGGQGLGLASAYGLVKQSQGFLLYDRSPLSGARFSIFLPEVELVPQRPVHSAVDTVPVILVAEDDLLLRMSISRGLERQGFRVRQAADGFGACNRLGSERPSLLLSDIRMPGVDGVELARRAHRLYPDLPILLMSAYADEAARAAVPGLTVSFLAKPFTLQTLGEKVKSLL